MSKIAKIMVRFAKYASSTLVGTCVDMLVLWLCSDVLLHGYVGEYIISPCISFEAAVITNYLVAYHFVWHDRVLLVPAKHGWLRFLRYNGSCILGFSVKMGILLLLHRWFQWDVLLCNIVALLFSGILNFSLQNLFVFRKRRLAKDKEKMVRKSCRIDHKFRQTCE